MIPSLTLQTIGGLASRMRAVIPAQARAEAMGVPLFVNWSSHAPTLKEDGGKFGCSLGELWEGFAEHDLHEILPKKKGGMRILTCHPEDFDPSTLPPLGYLFNNLTPAKPLAKAIRSLPNVPRGSLGIHIRTEYAQEEATPLGWYIRLLRNVPHSVPIVLSCENHRVSAMIRTIRPDVIEQEKTYDYDNMGIIRAAADIYLLSRCRWIAGSARSSFSQLASWAQCGGPDPESWKRVKHGDWRTWIYGDRYLDDKTHAGRKSDMLRDLQRKSSG